jgi:hypothetical protein
MKYNFKQERNDYQTPIEILSLVEFLTGRTDLFDCDVCCSEKNIPAREHYILGETDGLRQYWYEYNWCNPPYNECPKWVKKAYEEQQDGNSTVLLIPARTETKYWHDYILDEDGGTNRPNVKVRFLRKGYRFIHPETKQYMGVYKNALALVYFKGETCN